jgi:hypothetical protein
MLRLAGILVALALSGCASSLDIVDYRAFGPVDFQKQDAVKLRWAQLRDSNTPAPPEVEVYQQSGPKGVTIFNGTILVAKGAPYKLLGTFSITYGRLNIEPDEREAGDDLKRMAASANGNVVICYLTYRRDTRRVVLARGFVLQRVGAPPPPEP